jgi:surface antigen
MKTRTCFQVIIRIFSLFIFVLFILNNSVAQIYTCNPSVNTYTSPIDNAVNGSNCNYTFNGSGVLQFKVSYLNENQIVFAVKKADGSAFKTGTTLYIKESTSSDFRDIVCGTPFPSDGQDIGGRTSASTIKYEATFVGTHYFCAVTISSTGLRYYSGKIAITGKFDPNLTITSPNGGESFISGQRMDITWSSKNYSGDVVLELIGASSTTKVELISSQTADDGSFSWTIPSSLSPGNYRIKIFTYNPYGGTSDVSDASFKIGNQDNLMISPTGDTEVNSSSGTGSISVISNVNWNATSNQNWLTITSGSNGSNNGTITYSYFSNTNTNPRSATITVSGSGVSSKTLTISQQGVTPYLSINPDGTMEVSSTSGTGFINVNSNVSWTATSNQSWLTITSGNNGSNNGTINFSYSANTSNVSRSSTITVSIGSISKTLMIKQLNNNPVLVINAKQVVPQTGIILNTIFDFSFEVSGGSGKFIGGTLIFTAPDNNIYKKEMASNDNKNFSWSGKLRQVGVYKYYYQATQDNNTVSSGTYSLTTNCSEIINDYPYGSYNGTDCGDSAKLKADSWGFFRYQCTSWVAYKLYNAGLKNFSNSMFGGGSGFEDTGCTPIVKKERLSNACRWAKLAALNDVPVNEIPSIGSIAHWNPGELSTTGHVGYVECVEGNKVTISNYNGWDGPNFEYNKCNYGVFTIDISLGRSYNNPKPGRYIHINADGLGEVGDPTQVQIFGRETGDIVNIFPNPASGNIFIDTQGNIFAVQIINNQGQPVFYKANSSGGTINTSGFPKGIYYVRFISDKELFTRKLVIN